MRFLVILWRLGPLVVSFRRDWRRWLVAGSPKLRSPEFHQRRAQKLTNAIASLGPSFVKTGQVFSARPDLVPEPYLSTLGQLTDSLPFVPNDQIDQEIIKAYGRSKEGLFDTFNDAPLAAGSLGQVYRATYQGREVVVKILRPGVEALIAHDLRIVTSLLAWLAKYINSRHLSGFQIVLKEFSKTIQHEMDYHQEAAHTEYFRKHFASNPRLVIPEIIPELTRQRIIVMTYLDGLKVTDPDLPSLPGFEPSSLIGVIIEAYIQMMLVEGLFHADPHPGNLLIQPNGKVVLLDFGMVIPVLPSTRGILARTALAAVSSDARVVAQGFFDLNIVVPGTSQEHIQKLVEVLLRLAHQGARPPEVLKTLTDEVMETLYDWPILLTDEMVYFARAVALVEGLGAHLMPGFNIVQLATPVILTHRRAILTAIGETSPQKDPWTAWGDLFAELGQTLQNSGQSLGLVITKHLPSLFTPEQLDWLDPLFKLFMPGSPAPARLSAPQLPKLNS